VIEAFHRAHQARYGHRLELPVELVNLRVGLQGPPAAIELLELRSGGETTEPPPRATLYGVSDEVEVYQRSSLIAAQQMAGPALITEQVSTSYLAPGWSATVDPVGNLMLDRRQ
jgi:N-methylhydantoinase A